MSAVLNIAGCSPLWVLPNPSGRLIAAHKSLCCLCIIVWLGGATGQGGSKPSARLASTNGPDNVFSWAGSSATITMLPAGSTRHLVQKTGQGAPRALAMATGDSAGSGRADQQGQAPAAGIGGRPVTAGDSERSGETRADGGARSLELSALFGPY